MGDIVRVLIKVDSASVDGPWCVRFSLPERPGAPTWAGERTLHGTPAGDSRFPTVDDKAAGLPDPDEDHYKLCLGSKPDALSGLYGRITRRALIPGRREASLFGKYLFDTLIGRDTWNWILDQTTKTDLLELALAWNADQKYLHRLNWEMMHGPEAFLAAKQPKGPREIAITRVVADAHGAIRTAKPVPRCLFVIGTALTDTRIRPGAELLGLLRQIERSERALRGRVLRGDNGNGASPADIARAVEEFKPDFVHFICHGEFEDSGGPALELGEDPRDPGVKLRKTDKIFDYLNTGEAPPAAVVLSACNTGQSGQDDLLDGGSLEDTEAGEVAIRGAHQTAPMAAYLVRQGIPVVLGMAGRVADRACRHFSRRFGEALVKGESLVRATAEGRRAAFVEGDQPAGESVDWAFPAVFMAATVTSNYAPAPRDPAREPPVEDWVRAYDPKRGKEPAFCGRHEFFDAYYDLFDATKVSVLGVYVGGPEAASGATTTLGDVRHGKTRLLTELAVQAIRDGHVPVVVSNDNENREAPMTLEALLSSLLIALNHARDTYKVAVPAWQIGALQDLLTGDAAALAPSVLEAYREEQKAVTAKVIRSALAADMTQLLAQTHAKYEFLRDARGTAILMLDDIDKYWIGFLERWLDGKVLKAGGVRALQPPRDAPWDATTTVLPVVMTFSMAGAPKIVTKRIQEIGSTLTWMRLEQLKPFPPTHDIDLLAMQNVLLSPFDGNGNIRAGVSNCSFALNYKTRADNWETWTSEFRADFCGLPGYFTKREFYKQVYLASRNDFLKEADDETRLADYMKRDADK